MPRCPNGTRRNKKSGNCEPKRTTASRQRHAVLQRHAVIQRHAVRKTRSASAPKKSISKQSLDDIIDSMDLDPTKRAELEEMKPALKRMKYSKSYKSCFTGKSTRNIEDMISAKIQCWAKHGDDI